MPHQRTLGTEALMHGWATMVTGAEAMPAVCIAVRRHGATEPGLLILSDDLDRHQVIALLREAIRQLGGAFAG